jgi:uncharacterized membrane protein YtjA (UPF0391 family)
LTDLEVCGANGQPVALRRAISRDQFRRPWNRSATGPPDVVHLTGTQLQLRRYLSECGIAASVFEETNAMLGWAVTFLIIALIAAVLGFGGIAGAAVEIAKIIFFIAIALFLISAIFGFVRGRSPTVP